MSATVSQLLAVARGELGYQESRGADGHWTNGNKYGARYGADHQPWCAWFARWCMEEAGVAPGSYPTSGSCTINRTWAVSHDRWHPGVADARPGDIAIFNAHPGGTPAHTGIVESVGPGGINVTTIDGNTNSDGAAEGHAVERKTRPANRVLGVIRPDYTPEVAAVQVVEVRDDGKALLELGPKVIKRGEWVTVARLGIRNPKRSYRLSAHVWARLEKFQGERPAYVKVRWGREGWGKAQPGELDTTATHTHACPLKLPDSWPTMSRAEKSGGGVMAVQVFFEGTGAAFVEKFTIDAK